MDKYKFVVVRAEYSYKEITIESEDIETAHNEVLKKAKQEKFPDSCETDYSVRTIQKNNKPLIY